MIHHEACYASRLNHPSPSACPPPLLAGYKLQGPLRQVGGAPPPSSTLPCASKVEGKAKREPAAGGPGSIQLHVGASPPRRRRPLFVFVFSLQPVRWDSTRVFDSASQNESAAGEAGRGSEVPRQAGGEDPQTDRTGPDPSRGSRPTLAPRPGPGSPVRGL